MAKKTKRQLLSDIYNARHHTTLKDLEDLLKAHGFIQQPRRKRNKQVWKCRGFVVTLHVPHGRFVKAAAVDEVIRVIELAENARRSGNGTEDA